MHEGLSAPRFDARLRRGNSLIGARRATYSAAQASKAPWKGTSKSPVLAPTERPLADIPLGSEIGIHHFLLPGEGLGLRCRCDGAQTGKKGQPGLAEEWSEQVREWRKATLTAPAKSHVDRAVALSRRVEEAWRRAASAVASHLSGLQYRVDVWGADPALLPAQQATHGSTEFLEPEGPVARLRLLMDAWCALWFWAPADGTALPSLSQWLDAAELLLGQPTSEESGQLFSAYEADSVDLDTVEVYGKATIPQILERHPWLVACQRIAERQGFFHWELEFAPVFAAGRV